LTSRLFEKGVDVLLTYQLLEALVFGLLFLDLDRHLNCMRAIFWRQRFDSSLLSIIIRIVLLELFLLDHVNLLSLLSLTTSCTLRSLGYLAVTR